MENSQSQQASTNASVSTSHARKIYTNEDVVRIRPTTRKGDVWSNYDMCIMIDGVEKARCKKCMKFYNPGSNSTLRTHKSGCNAVSQNDTSQGTIGADGQVFIFDNDAVRLDFTMFCQFNKRLPFNTLRHQVDAFKLWETAKKDIIDGFRDYKYGVSITTDTWTAPHDYLDGVDRVQHETSLEGPILEDVEETIAREEVELGISPPNTELDEGEFEDLDIEHVDVEDFLEDLMD
ncbi:hypothetical protein Tco_0475024 [Tanacetum coccineum]